MNLRAMYSNTVMLEDIALLTEIYGILFDNQSGECIERANTDTSQNNCKVNLKDLRQKCNNL